MYLALQHPEKRHPKSKHPAQKHPSKKCMHMYPTMLTCTYVTYMYLIFSLQRGGLGRGWACQPAKSSYILFCKTSCNYFWWGTNPPKAVTTHFAKQVVTTFGGAQTRQKQLQQILQNKL